MSSFRVDRSEALSEGPSSVSAGDCTRHSRLFSISRLRSRSPSVLTLQPVCVDRVDSGEDQELTAALQRSQRRLQRTALQATRASADAVSSFRPEPSVADGSAFPLLEENLSSFGSVGEALEGRLNCECSPLEGVGGESENLGEEALLSEVARDRDPDSLSCTRLSSASLSNSPGSPRTRAARSAGRALAGVSFSDAAPPLLGARNGSGRGGALNGAAHALDCSLSSAGKFPLLDLPSTAEREALDLVQRKQSQLVEAIRSILAAESLLHRIRLQQMMPRTPREEDRLAERPEPSRHPEELQEAELRTLLKLHGVKLSSAWEKTQGPQTTQPPAGASASPRVSLRRRKEQTFSRLFAEEALAEEAQEENSASAGSQQSAEERVLASPEAAFFLTHAPPLLSPLKHKSVVADSTQAQQQLESEQNELNDDDQDGGKSFAEAKAAASAATKRATDSVSSSTKEERFVPLESRVASMRQVLRSIDRESPAASPRKPTAFQNGLRGLRCEASLVELCSPRSSDVSTASPETAFARP